MKWLTLLLALALPASLQAAEVYRWVDARGLVHYSSMAPRDYAYERIDPGAQPRAAATLANPRDAADTSSADADAQQPVSPQRNGTGQAPSNDDLGLTEEQRERRAQLQSEAESRREQLEAQRQEQCERARRQYEELTTHTRVRIVDDSGQETLLSDDELQARIAAARDGIVMNCD